MHFDKVLITLGEMYGATPMEQAFADNHFQFLAAVMLSARSRDAMTIPTARRLFEIAPTPQAILALPVPNVEKILRPIGFYRVKTKYLRGLCQKIIREFGSKVPETFEELVTLPGVSRKVANVVLGQLFDKDVIAVDTHVHRISNRLGWAVTQKPEETERELGLVLPKQYWRILNGLLVHHGQQICLSIRPLCHVCPISRWCPKIGVQ